MCLDARGLRERVSNRSIGWGARRWALLAPVTGQRGREKWRRDSPLARGIDEVRAPAGDKDLLGALVRLEDVLGLGLLAEYQAARGARAVPSGVAQGRMQPS